MKMRHLVAILFVGLLLAACDSAELIAPNYRPQQYRIIPDQLISWEGVKIDLSDYFSDPDENELTYSATNDFPEIISTEIEGSLLTISQSNHGVVEAVVTVTASDGTAETSSSFFVQSSTLIFEEWNSKEDLEGWKILPEIWGDAQSKYPAFVDVEDGMLRMYPSSKTNHFWREVLGIEMQLDLEPLEPKSWTFSTRFGMASEDTTTISCITFDVYTNDPYYRGIAFTIYPEYFWNLQVFGPERPFWQFLENGEGDYNDGFEGNRWEMWDLEIKMENSRMTIILDGEELDVVDLRQINLRRPTRFDWPPLDYPTSVSKIGMQLFPFCIKLAGNIDNPKKRGSMIIDYTRLDVDLGR